MGVAFDIVKEENLAAAGRELPDGLLQVDATSPIGGETGPLPVSAVIGRECFPAL